MLLNSFFNKFNRVRPAGGIFRLISLLGALTLALTGVLLTLSIGASLFDWDFISRGPGNFFSRSYGFLSYMVPAYLFWAAWILASRVFKPGRIFTLSAVLFPFLTLAAGFTLVRDFEFLQRDLLTLRVLG
ncbi:MAG: hypothetical protein LBQ44_01405, partial [Treponema sp.]|nr:hypothetical protein [Treponema sp.]